MSSRNIQFGCGMCAPSSWTNFDAGPAFWLESHIPFVRRMLVRRGFPDYPRNIRFGDAIKGLPVAPASADAIYCSHVLEHMAREEFRSTLRNVYSYLRPGGVFRFVLPDLEFYVRRYVAAADDLAAPRFMEGTLLGEENVFRGARALPRALFGRSRHLWMWDGRSMAHELAAAGFVNIRRAVVGDSPLPQFAEVEDRGRWEDNLGMECQKPEPASAKQDPSTASESGSPLSGGPRTAP